MDSILQWILIVIAISVPSLIAGLFSYFLHKKKVQAETEEIKLKNKITKDITYNQLKTESKQKDIKGKLDIFQRLTKLEEEIKNKENKTASDQKKLESLEMIKKEFKQSFRAEENPRLVETEKRLEAKKENEETVIKKIKSAKTNFKNKKYPSKNRKKRK